MKQSIINRRLKRFIRQAKSVIRNPSSVIRLIGRFRAKRRQIALVSLMALIILIPVVIFLMRSGNLAEAGWWPGDGNQWVKRKNLELFNTTSESLAATTTVAVTVNTKELVAVGKLREDCGDLRVLYQPNNTTATEVTRHLIFPVGETCSTSETTKVNFPLQGTLSASSRTYDYYMYFNNPDAEAPTETERAFDIGSKQATLVCPFNGTTTCVAGETPSTETGAIRYGGEKGAMSFDGSGDYINAGSANILDQIPEGDFTLEGWVNPSRIPAENWQQQHIFAKWSTNGGLRNWHCGFIRIDTLKLDCELVFASSSSVSRSTTEVPLNQWHHVAYVYDSSTRLIRMFLNGNEVDYTTYSAGSGALNHDNSYNVTVGARQGGNAPISGMLDEVRISNFARYTSNFTPQITPFVRDDNTVLLYHFDENGDDPRNAGKALDDSGNNNHGTITGAKYVAGLVGVDSGQAGVTPSAGNVASQSYASHEGIFIEEGTTNKITNPSFEHATFNTNWAFVVPIDFDAGETTFTAGMAKRNSSGPFAAGLTATGFASGTEPGDQDVISYPRGTLIAGGVSENAFHSNHDSFQGSIVMWVTPEWNGNDGQRHHLYTGNYSSNVAVLYKDTDSKLYWDLGWYFTISVDVSDWEAGQTKMIVVRWDRKNPIDGTNYLSLSVDDTHTFARTSVGSGIAYNTDPKYIGGRHDKRYPANAVIEGLTVYRRPLFDGTYGIDVGNGDEIAQIYNSGTGKDPTLVTGSWDVVFALPTNASTGALTTGTGNAWTHPHASNLLYTSTTNTGGFMMNGTYTSDGWADIGTPTVVALNTADKIYAGGYAVESDQWEGIYYDKTVTAGDDWVIRGVVSSDGVCQPQLILYDQTNGAEIGSLYGTTGSTRTDPDVLLFTGEAPSGMTTLRVKAVNAAASTGSCNWHQVELLSNRMTNPSVEYGTGDPWIPTGWDPGNDPDAGELAQSSDEYTGQSSLEVIGMTSIENVRVSSSLNGLNKFFSVGAYLKATQSSLRIGRYNLGPDFQFNHGGTFNIGVSDSNWTLAKGVGRTTATDGWANALSLQPLNTASGHADDFYAFQLNDVSLTAVPANLANSTESTGIRVDGADTLTQAISGITATSGQIAFKITPRHSWGTAANFGSSNPVLATFYHSANDYLKVHYQSAGVIRLAGMFNGVAVNADSSQAPTLNAGTTYDIGVNYASGENLELYIEGSRVAVSAMSGNSFGTAPTTAYWGSDNSGLNQYDATFAASGASLTVTENTNVSNVKFGTKSAKLVAGDAPVNYTTAVDAGNTNTHTLSAYVYDGTAGNIGGTVGNSVAALLFNGITQTTTYTDMGGGWWRLTYSGAAGSGTQPYGVQVKAGKTIYVDGVQLEEKQFQYATSYADGSLGTGYSWAGTENESSSVREVSNVSDYARDGNISCEQGTISFWMKKLTNFPQVSEYYPRIISTSGVTDNYLAFTQGYRGSSLVFRLQGYNPSYYRIDTSYTITGWGLNTWHHVAATYQENGDSILYVDGVARNTQPLGDLVSNCGTGFRFDYALGGSSVPGNQAFSDLRTFDSPLSSTEIADLYQAGLVSHTQGYEVERFSTVKGQDPLAIWRFDEGQGNIAYDSSNYRHDLTVSGATWNTQTTGSTSQFIRNLVFDGVDDAAVLGAKEATGFNFNNDSFTLSGWFRHPVAVSGTDTIISKYTGDKGYRVYMNANGYLCFGIGDGTNTDSACSEQSYTDSKWHHFEAVRAADKITLYIDGMEMAEDASLTASGGLSNNAAFTVGADSNSTNYWEGNLDNLIVYPYARTADEVKTDFAGGQTAAYFGANQNDFLSDGLIGYWKMEEASWNGTSGEVKDASGNSRHGTRADNATTGTGKFGRGGVFDGDSDKVDVPFSATLSQYSVATWLKLTEYESGSTLRTIIASGPDRMGLRIAADGDNPDLLEFATQNTGGGSANIAGPVIPLDTWTQAVGTWDGKELRLYVNGEQVGAIEKTSSLSLTDLLIGGSTGRWFDGNIDETRLYNRALSAAEVKSLYQWAPGPVGYWKMEERSDGTSPVTRYDSSGYGNHLTDENTTASTQGKFGTAAYFEAADNQETLTISDEDQNGLNITGPMTVSAWIKPKSLEQIYNTVVNKGVEEDNTQNSYTLYVHTSGIARFGVSSNGINWTSVSSNVSNIIPENWYYITGVYNGSDLRIYINGQLSSTPISYTSGIFDGTGGVFVGASEWTNGRRIYPFDGTIDEVKFYNYARTPQQIVEDMNAGHPVGGSPISSKVSEWKLDEMTGTTAYDSGFSGRNLTLVNSPTWVREGKFNSALDFESSSSQYGYAADSSAHSITGSLSLSAWIKPESITSSTLFNIAGKWDGANESYLLSQFGDEIRMYIDSSSNYVTTNNTNLQTGTWYHVLGVYDSSAQTAKIYIDGVLQATTTTGTIPSSIGDDAGRFHIGAEDSTTTAANFYDGVIDQVELYNSALTSDQVKIVFNAGAAVNFGAGSDTEASTLSDGAGNPPIAYWNFEEGSGTALNDRSGNNNHGTISGATWANVTGKPKNAFGLGGKALSFDGVDDYIDIGTGPGTVRTVSFWAYPRATTTYFINLTGTSDYIWLNNGTVTATGFSTPTIYIDGQVTSTMVTNKWQHVTVTSATAENASNLDIGRTQDANYMNGMIDEVKLYDYVRTRAQIMYDFNRGAPIGHWKFDECSGTVANDESGFGNNGTISIGATGSYTSAGTCGSGVSSQAWNAGSSGKYGASLGFDGTDDSVDIGDLAYTEGATTVSWSFWMKPINLAALKCLICKINDNNTETSWAIETGTGSFGGEDDLIIGIPTTTSDGLTYAYTTSNILSSNVWKYVTVVFDGSKTGNENRLSVYVNGKKQTLTYSGTIPSSTQATTSNALIGSSSDGARYYNGLIDDVRIYNYALSPLQILNIYNSGSVYFGP